MKRVFKISGNELRSAMEGGSVDSPLAIVGAFSDDEQLMRLFYRAYDLGRRDKAREIKAALEP
jgi:hypothetical protein